MPDQPLRLSIQTVAGLDEPERGHYGQIVDTLRLLDGIATAQKLDPLSGFLGETADTVEGLVLLVGVLKAELAEAMRVALGAV